MYRFCQFLYINLSIDIDFSIFFTYAGLATYRITVKNTLKSKSITCCTCCFGKTLGYKFQIARSKYPYLNPRIVRSKSHKELNLRFFEIKINNYIPIGTESYSSS